MLFGRCFEMTLPVRFLAGRGVDSRFLELNCPVNWWLDQLNLTNSEVFHPSGRCLIDGCYYHIDFRLTLRWPGWTWSFHLEEQFLQFSLPTFLPFINTRDHDITTGYLLSASKSAVNRATKSIKVSLNTESTHFSRQCHWVTHHANLWYILLYFLTTSHLAAFLPLRLLLPNLFCKRYSLVYAYQERPHELHAS